MCGIVSIVAKSKTKFSYKHRNMFENMLYLDYLRGEDSTGIYAVNKYGNVSWAKSTDIPQDFLKNTAVSKIMSDVPWDYNVVVGHNRKATKGSVKDENAHPFVEEDIILVHNGTLTNHKDLNDTVEVDSHAIAHAIKEHGVVDAISKIEGAFAVIAYNVTEKKLFAFRNKERPLWLLDTEDAWVLASEPWMAYGAAWRNDIKPGQLKELAPATLLTFDLSDDFEFTLSEQEVKLYEKKFLPTIVSVSTKTGSTTHKKRSFAGKKNLPQEFIDRFVKGTPVVFKPERIIPVGVAWQISGVHWELDNVTVNAGCSAINYTEEEARALLKHEYLVADVTGISYSSVSGKGFVFSENPVQSAPLISVNGMILNEELVEHLAGECTSCGANIDQEELEESYVRINNKGKRIIHVCPACVQANLFKNPLWGGVRAYEEACNSVLH